MGFWDDHTVMWIVGLVFTPRLMLLYFGIIKPGLIPPILGFFFVPRMFLASVLTAVYGETNPILIVIAWILAIIIDIVGNVVKTRMTMAICENQKEMLRQRISFLNGNNRPTNFNF